MKGIDPIKIQGLGIALWWENLKAMSSWDKMPEGWRFPTIKELKLLNEFHELGILGIEPGSYTGRVPTPEGGSDSTPYIKEVKIPKDQAKDWWLMTPYVSKHFTRLVKDL